MRKTKDHSLSIFFAEAKLGAEKKFEQNKKKKKWNY